MCNHDNSKKWQLRGFPPTVLGNPVKFADPTGMQIVTPSDMPLTGPTGVVPQNGGGAFGVVNTYWEYDPSNSCNPVWLVVEGSYNGANNSNDYFVNYTTSGNSIYVASVMADHKNAIDWQIANASAKAMEGVNVGGQGWNRFGNINNGVAFVSSSAFEYVSKSLNKSLEYFTEGVSTTKDIHFKMPDIEIKGWKCPHFNVYIHNVGFVSNVASAAKFLGKLTGWVGIGMTGYELYTGQKEWLGEGGLDVFMGVVGFCGPYGWAISGAYFGGKMILEYTGNKFW